MKRKNKYENKDQNTKQTIAWLTRTIDAELARGEEADEQLILECAEYLQELSPETAIPAVAVEKRLQTELNSTQTTKRLAHRKMPRRAIKLVLRLAAVIAALAMFCAAVPAMAIYISNESNLEDNESSALNPVLEFLSNPIKPDPVDYADTTKFIKEPGYKATYTDTEEMIRAELPPDILCPNGLTEELMPYQITFHYYGYANHTDSPFDAWSIRWNAANEQWRFLVTCRKNFKPINTAYYELLYDTYESGGRTYFYWVLKNGQYRAFGEYDRLIYDIIADDYETMIYLIDHATPASEIIPDVDPEPDTSTDTDEPIVLLEPDQYERPHRYSATYATTAKFIEYEGINLLAVDDAAEGLGDFTIKVQHGSVSKTNPAKWDVRWESANDLWSVWVTFYPEDQEYHRADYEATPRYTEQYPVNGRTFYITKNPLQPLDHPDNDPQEYLVNYFEGNLLYSIHVTGRETLELLLNSIAMTAELAAK